ncbi:MAG: GTP 3',8-cyclase MoaA [Peptococcaceae bacterium]|jgi:cyclic pyranopterin phosphate synthase|nr:GTP 3',8-cyclase MoaA [Peptococcaceae bacterium]
MMRDSYGRVIDYLRLSVTDRCNLRCRYCMPNHGVELLRHDQVLRNEEMTRLCGILVSLGISKIKITGGEPLARKGVPELIRRLKALPGLEAITLTTNGALLAARLERLISAGVAGVNVSLDTLDRATFLALTGVDALPQALDGIARAVDSGIPLKLNCVPIEGVNEEDLTRLAALARDQELAVRFIELMPIGLGQREKGIAPAEVKRRLEEAFGPLRPWEGRLGNGPAVYYQLAGFRGKIGFIPAVSHGFCDSCDRIRLTADGYLKLCLARDTGVDLKGPLRAGASDGELAAAILAAIEKKPRRHGFGQAEVEDKNSRDMHKIGG